MGGTYGYHAVPERAVRIVTMQCQIGRYVQLPGSVRVGCTYNYHAVSEWAVLIVTMQRQSGRYVVTMQCQNGLYV